MNNNVDERRTGKKFQRADEKWKTDGTKEEDKINELEKRLSRKRERYTETIDN